jgi:micrococcal nuclease
MNSATRPLALAVLILALAPADGGRAADLQWSAPVDVVEVRPDLDLALADGRTLRLSGLRVPDALLGEAGALIRGLLAKERAVRLATEGGAPYDRYGRLVVQVERTDALWLQGALLERGLAWVQTRPGDRVRLDAMRALEDEARAGRLGLWGDSDLAPRAAEQAGRAIGSFQIVSGRILRVDPVGDYVYLNFGEDWWEDFTLRLRQVDVRERFEPAGVRVSELAGRRVEARGLVLEAGGPLIDLSHPEQLMVLP